MAYSITGAIAIRDSLSRITWLVLMKQNEMIASIGHRPCRKKREPVKISTKPLTGERMHRETRKVSPTDVVPANRKSTIQFGRWKTLLRSPSIV